MKMNKKTISLLMINTVLTLPCSHGSQYDHNLNTQRLTTYGPPLIPSNEPENNDNRRKSQTDRESEQIKRRRIEESNTNNTGLNLHYMSPEVIQNLLTIVRLSTLALKGQADHINNLLPITPAFNIDPNVIQNIQADLRHVAHVIEVLSIFNANIAATISTPMQIDRSGNGSNNAQPLHTFQPHHTSQTHNNRAVSQKILAPSAASSIPAASIPQQNSVINERNPQTQNNNLIILDDSPSPKAHAPINNAPPLPIPAPNLLQTNGDSDRGNNIQIHHDIQTHNTRAVSQEQTSSSPSHPPIITPPIPPSNRALNSQSYRPGIRGNPNKVNNIDFFDEVTYDSLQEYEKIFQYYKESNQKFSLLDYQNLLNCLEHVSYDYGRNTISIITHKGIVYICKDLTSNWTHTLFNSIENTECKELIFQIFRNYERHGKRLDFNKINPAAISVLIESGIIFNQDHKTIAFLKAWLQRTNENVYYTSKQDICTLLKEFPLTYVDPLMRLKSSFWDHCFVPCTYPPSLSQIKKLNLLISLQEMSKRLRNMSDSNISSVPENSSEHIPNVTNSVPLTNAPQGEIVNSGSSISLTNTAQRETVVEDENSIPLTNAQQGEIVNNGDSVPLTSAPQNDIFDNWYETTFTPFSPNTEYYLDQFKSLVPNDIF